MDRRGGVGGIELLARRDVDGDALALIAILRLDDHRQADVLGGGPAVVGVRHRTAERHRYAGCIEQLLGKFLVLGDGFGDAAGAVDFGRLDAALLGTPAELHQAAAGEAPVRNAACDGRVDDGARARAEALGFVQIAQLGDGRRGVEFRTVLRGVDELLGQFQRAAADRFFAVLESDLIDAFLDGARGMAEIHRAAGLRLQRHCGVFEHVGQRERLAQHDRVQFTDGREKRAKAGLEAGQAPDGVLVVLAIDDRLDAGMAAPEIGAAQGADACDVHVVISLRCFAALARVRSVGGFI